MKKKFKKILYVSLTILAICSQNILATTNQIETSSRQIQKVRIGVLAKRGFERCLERWTPTAQYLTETLGDVQCEIVPLGFDEVHDAVHSAVEHDKVDFVLVNSSMYVALEIHCGISRLATLANLRMGHEYNVFGGVIFSLAGKPYDSLDDLKNTNFMAVDPLSFGGWQTAWLELKKAGINPYKDFKTMSYGMTHDDVVKAVQSGVVDAGTVRTDTLERMAKENKINLEDFKILNQQPYSESFPFALSTQLYPEWPFSKVDHTSRELADRVAMALMEMPPDHPAAQAANCAGWTIPSNYQSVRDCLKELRQPPYQDYGKVTLWAAIKQLSGWLMVVGVLFCIAVYFVVRSRKLNYSLKQTLKKSEELALLAQKNSKAKGLFLANMSHEIRTPINAVTGLSELLLKTSMTARQSDYVKKIQSSSKNLLGIINNILDYSKVESGKIELEASNFKLDEILNNLANVVSLPAETKGLELLFDVDPNVPQHLIGDPLRLSQVLVNLCNNAIKFTEHGFVLVKISLGRDVGVEDTVVLHFDIRDSGIGIPPEKVDSVFESFSQADNSTTRTHGGTGLGLSISQCFVNLMGGEITVKSKLNYGSTFSFDCHLKKQKDAQDSSFAELTEKPLKALIVDDNDFSRNILKNYLSSFSIQVDMVPSGMDAINKLSEDPDYDFILMDYNMPGLNGIMTTERIKMLFEKAHLPSILMVTAYGSDEVYKNACLAGVDSFLTKPINQSLLYDSLVEVMDTSSSSKLNKQTKELSVAKSIEGARLLVVEDNRINQQVAQGLLEDIGFEVVLANHGLQAVEKLHQDSDFDAILMDVQMPVMDGREATKRIRHMSKPICDIPIIALTAHALSSEKKRCIDAGMDGHVSKPIQMDELLEELEKLVTVKPGRKTQNKPNNINVELDIPAELDGLDVAAGIAMVGGNHDLFRKLLVNLYKDYIDFETQINEAVEKNDVEFIERSAHTLKGIGGTIKADKLTEISADLELKLANGASLDEVPIKKFTDEVNRIMKSISVLNNNSENENNDKEDIINDPEISKKIMQLKAYCVDGDFRTTDAFVQLMPHLKAFIEDDELTKLKACIEAFEYDDALKILEKNTVL